MKKENISDNVKDTESLKDIDHEDLYFWILDVEKSYNITIEEGDLSVEMSFGKFIDAIVNKIKLTNTNDCTSQQTFYKIRESLSLLLNIDKKYITPNSSLEEIIPSKKRISNLRIVEENTGVSFISYLESPVDGYLFFTIFITIILSIPWMIICDKLEIPNPLYYLIPFIIVFFCSLGLKTIYKIKSNFQIKTIRDLVEDTISKNYFKYRDNPTTYNKSEVRKLLVTSFSNFLYIDISKLTNDAKFN